MNGISSLVSMPSAVQSATAAINRGVAGVSRAAAVVASSSVSDPSDVLAALIDSRQQLLYTQAAAGVMSAADEMLGTLIDIRA